MNDSPGPLIAKVLAVALVLILLAAAWQLREVLLLFFGAGLLAIALRAGADAIARLGHLGPRLSLVCCILAVLVLLGLAGWLFGSQFSQQVLLLQQKLPQAWDAAQQWLQSQSFGQQLLRLTGQALPTLSQVGTQLKQVTITVWHVLLGLLLIGFGAIYLAADPDTYRTGVLKLVPPSFRQRAQDTLAECTTSLRHWLLSQLLVMVIVGSLAGAGLWLVGVPAPLALGVVMAILEFVPFAGPVVAAVPGILLAFTVSPATAGSALAVYLVVQQLESNLIAPMIARRMLRLPPALVIFAIVSFGIVLGPLGLVFAMPLTVSLAVIVDRLYVRGVLAESAPRARP